MSLRWRDRREGTTVQRMGLMDKAKDLLNQHDDKVDQGLDKAGEAAKGRFEGHDDQIDGAVGKAKGATGDGDTTAPAPAPEEQPPPNA